MDDPEPGKIVEGEIVEGVPKPPPLPQGPKTFFHPLSGAAILAVDWLAFGADLFSGFAALAVLSLAAFAATYWAVYRIQSRRAGDGPGMANVKAFLGALAAGVPFPIGGTIVGAAILVLSGLPLLGKRKSG